MEPVTGPARRDLSARPRERVEEDGGSGGEKGGWRVGRGEESGAAGEKLNTKAAQKKLRAGIRTHMCRRH